MNWFRSPKPLDASPTLAKDALSVSFSQQEEGGMSIETARFDVCRIYLHIDGARSLNQNSPNNLPPKSVSFVKTGAPLTFSYPPGFRYICISATAATLGALSQPAHPGTASKKPTVSEALATPSELVFSQMVNLTCMMALELERRATTSLNTALALLLKITILAEIDINDYKSELRAIALQQDRQRHAIARVERYIDEHLTADVSLADAAAIACLSPNYLSRLLRQELGRGFSDIVTERRLQLSCELIVATDLKISAISRKCGYAEETYFARRFRQWYGCTAGQWRERHSSLLEPFTTLSSPKSVSDY